MEAIQMVSCTASSHEHCAVSREAQIQIQVQIQNGCILGLCDRQVPGNRNSNKSNTEELAFLIIYEIEDKLNP